MIRLISAAMALFLCAPAYAHSWYPYDCCSERDCYPMPARDVTVTREGYALKDGTQIPFRDARPSPDGQYHICRYEDGKGKLIHLPEKPACFWAPMGAS